MYIYKTTNLLNGKIYVGKSKFHINENKNYYGSGIILKKAIQKYGKENFKKEIIDVAISISELNKKEIYWIKKLDAKNKKIGYNIANGGDGGNTGGMKPETIKRKQKIGPDGLSDFSRQSKKRLASMSKESIKKSVEKANKTKQQILPNGLTIAQDTARKANLTKTPEQRSKSAKKVWDKKTEKEKKEWGKLTSKHMKKYFEKNPSKKKERAKLFSEACKNTISAYHILTKERKRIPIEIFENNILWVGTKWKGFYEVIIPNKSRIILTRKKEIREFANKIGVKEDWIERRKNSHLPFKHRQSRHKHLDGTIIIKHSPSEVNLFFQN